MEEKSVVVMPARRLLRIADAANYLSCTLWFMEDALRSGVIPFVTLGKRRLVDVKALDAFVDKQKTKAA